MSFQNKELVYFWATQKTEEEEVLEILRNNYNQNGFSLGDTPKELLETVKDKYLESRPVTLKQLQQYQTILDCEPSEVLSFLVAIENGEDKFLYMKIPNHLLSVVKGRGNNKEDELPSPRKEVNYSIFSIVCTDDRYTHLINTFGRIKVKGKGILTPIPNQRNQSDFFVLRTDKNVCEILIVTKKDILVFRQMTLEIEPDFVYIQQYFLKDESEKKYFLVYGKTDQESGEEYDVFCFEFNPFDQDDHFTKEINCELVDRLYDVVDQTVDNCSNALTLWNKRVNKYTTVSRIYSKEHFLEEDEDVSAVYGDKETIMKAYIDGTFVMNNKKITNVPKNVFSVCAFNLLK